MKKNGTDILMTKLEELDDYVDKLAEYKKYGIDYCVPHFEPVMMFSGEDLVAVPYFYLGSDIQKSDKLRDALDKYNKVFWLYSENRDAVNPFKQVAAELKYNSSLRKLKKVEKAENIKCYSRSEMNKYLKDYKAEKETELEKAKAVEKSFELEK